MATVRIWDSAKKIDRLVRVHPVAKSRIRNLGNGYEDPVVGIRRYMWELEHLTKTYPEELDIPQSHLSETGIKKSNVHAGNKFTIKTGTRNRIIKRELMTIKPVSLLSS